LKKGSDSVSESKKAFESLFALLQTQQGEIDFEIINEQAL